MTPRPAFLTLLCAVVLSPAPAAADLSRDDRWREDLSFLVEQLTERHPEPFFASDARIFHRQARSLRDAVATLEDSEIVVELMRLAATLRDGHTSVAPPSRRFGFDRLHPIRFEYFHDGWFVRAASARYADYVGARVLRIGSVTVEEAFARVSRLTSADNRFGLWRRAPLLLSMPAVLHAVDVSRGDELRLELDLPGQGRTRVSIGTDAAPAGHDWYYETEGVPAAESTTAHDRSSLPLPLYLRHLDRPFWLEVLPQRQALYLQLNRVANGQDETLAQFCQRAFDLIDDHGLTTLIVDLRHNPGGNNQLLRPLIHGILRRDAINRPGGLFVITGRATFSAAISCAAWMEEHTHALFVGEPAAAPPNHYGEPMLTTLPHSGLRLWVSTQFWQHRLPWDRRPWIVPDLAAPLTSADYANNRDPSLEAIFQYDARATLTATLRATLEAEGATALSQTFARYKARHPDLYGRTSKRELGAFARELVTAGRTEAAQAVFALTLEVYPRSAMACEGLASILLEQGRRDEAIELFRKALAIDPDLEHSARMLEKLAGL